MANEDVIELVVDNACPISLIEVAPGIVGGGGGGGGTWANARTYTDGDGNVWLQFKDDVSGKFRTMFLHNGQWSQGPEVT